MIMLMMDIKTLLIFDAKPSPRMPATPLRWSRSNQTAKKMETKQNALKSYYKSEKQYERLIALFKGVTRIAEDMIERIYFGYEMDCMISSEFTPAPDYSHVTKKIREILDHYRASEDLYYDWLKAMSDKHINNGPTYSNRWESLLITLVYSQNV